MKGEAQDFCGNSVAVLNTHLRLYSSEVMPYSSEAGTTHSAVHTLSVMKMMDPRHSEQNTLFAFDKIRSYKFLLVRIRWLFSGS